ncbi:contact-dependent growth inhibition system immunity protein [Streptomyces griseosporeus]|uniref:contact-dependent growth inhibition system immunity protein n=1 Tax=Streptomyces griseosporeus TaxID=1910 RepID=UPI0036C29893
MLSDVVDKDISIDRWPDSPPDSTHLVRSIHALRRRPVKDLTVEDLRRLIGQDVGLQWLMSVALDFLRERAPQESTTGWYDDDLLTAVLTRKGSLWRSRPEFARHLDETVRSLTDLSPYVRREVENFRGLVSDLL